MFWVKVIITCTTSDTQPKLDRPNKLAENRSLYLLSSNIQQLVNTSQVTPQNINTTSCFIFECAKERHTRRLINGVTWCCNLMPRTQSAVAIFIINIICVSAGSRVRVWSTKSKSFCRLCLCHSARICSTFRTLRRQRRVSAKILHKQDARVNWMRVLQTHRWFGQFSMDDLNTYWAACVPTLNSTLLTNIFMCVKSNWISTFGVWVEMHRAFSAVKYI